LGEMHQDYGKKDLIKELRKVPMDDAEMYVFELGYQPTELSGFDDKIGVFNPQGESDLLDFTEPENIPEDPVIKDIKDSVKEYLLSAGWTSKARININNCAQFLDGIT